MTMLPMKTGPGMAPASAGGGMTQQQMGLLGLGIGLLSGNPRTQGLASGLQAYGQAYSPQAAMQQRLMQQQLADLERRRAQDEAFKSLMLGTPQSGDATMLPPTAAAPSMVEPTLGGSLVDMPGGGTEPGQVQTAMRAPEPSTPAGAMMNLPASTRQLMATLGPQHPLTQSIMAQVYKPQAAQAPYSTIGKLIADREAGRISDADFEREMEIRSRPETQINLTRAQTPVGKIAEDVAAGRLSPEQGDRLARKAQTYPETQTKAADFANQMITSEAEMEALVEGGLDPSNIREQAFSMLPGGNYALTPEFQRYKQAQANWVRAKLRRESGAVIGAEEMQQEIETFFPQPGDSPEVRARKAQARKTATEGLKKASQGAYEDLFAPKAPTAETLGSLSDADFLNAPLTEENAEEWLKEAERRGLQ